MDRLLEQLFGLWSWCYELVWPLRLPSFKEAMALASKGGEVEFGGFPVSNWRDAESGAMWDTVSPMAKLELSIRALLGGFEVRFQSTTPVSSRAELVARNRAWLTGHIKHPRAFVSRLRWHTLTSDEWKRTAAAAYQDSDDAFQAVLLRQWAYQLKLGGTPSEVQEARRCEERARKLHPIKSRSMLDERRARLESLLAALAEARKTDMLHWLSIVHSNGRMLLSTPVPGGDEGATKERRLVRYQGADWVVLGAVSGGTFVPEWGTDSQGQFSKEEREVANSAGGSEG